MSSISAANLLCVFPGLEPAKASSYASLLSQTMGIHSSCAWAALLGNIGTESAGLTEWTQNPCNAATAAPYCGRGPLQITGESNYKYCAAQAACGCGSIVSKPEMVSDYASVGIGTASCVWNVMSGHSLSGMADGSLAGFRATACTINAGHADCGVPNGWESRQAYWRTATQCLAEQVEVGAAVSSDTCDCVSLNNCLASEASMACFPSFGCASFETGQTSACIHNGLGSQCLPEQCAYALGATWNDDDDDSEMMLRVASDGDGSSVSVGFIWAAVAVLVAGIVVLYAKFGRV